MNILVERRISNQTPNKLIQYENRIMGLAAHRRKRGKYRINIKGRIFFKKNQAGYGMLRS